MFKEMLISPFSFLAMIHKMFDDQIQMALRKHISNVKFKENSMQSLPQKHRETESAKKELSKKHRESRMAKQIKKTERDSPDFEER